MENSNYYMCAKIALKLYLKHVLSKMENSCISFDKDTDVVVTLSLYGEDVETHITRAYYDDIEDLVIIESYTDEYGETTDDFEEFSNEEMQMIIDKITDVIDYAIKG